MGEKELSDMMGINNGNPNLVCENKKNAKLEYFFLNTLLFFNFYERIICPESDSKCLES